MWLALLPAAFAHGGQPVADAVLLDEAGEVVVVATSHGLLFEDGTWVCEEALGADRLRTDEAWVDGALLVATTGGLARSADGCDWTWEAALEGSVVWSLAVDDGGVWAATEAALWRSTDAGETWAVAHPAEGLALRAVAAAPDGALWALGFDAGAPVARRHDAEGWRAWALPEAGGRLEVLTVDDAGRLLARAPLASGDDTLLRVSGDGVEVLLETALPLTAAAADGGVLHAAVSGLGTAVSLDDGATWSLPRLPALACLRVAGPVRLGCPDDASGVALAATAAAEPDPAAWSWAPALPFAAVAGPRCEPGALPVCDSLWEAVAVELGAAPAPQADTGAPALDAPPPTGGCGGGLAACVLGLAPLARRRLR